MQLRLGEMPSPVIGGRPTLLLPLGSCRPHGPHLPMGTDAALAEAVADRVAELARTPPPVLVAPAVRHGAAGDPGGEPGTVSIGSEALVAVLVEVGRSTASWAGRLLVINGDSGNVPALAEAVLRLRGEGRDAAWLPCSLPGADARAGHVETSLMLALAPWTVRVSAGGPAGLRPAGAAHLHPAGAGGACPGEGRRLLAELVDDALAALRAWCPGDDGRLRVPHPPEPLPEEQRRL